MVPNNAVRMREKLTEGCCMAMFSAVLCQGFEHCNKLKYRFSNLKIVIADFFKPGFFVFICSFVTVKHGKPDFY